MPTLGEYTNVYNTALLILQRKGFQVWYEKANDTYCAERDGWDFMADSPTGLLGLVAIYEHKRPGEWQEYWWKEMDPFILRSLPTAPRPYESVMKPKPK